MNQISDILTLANQAATQNIDAVLATVVHTEGSAYRRAGAMMLICEDGRTVGMVSGGCLEPHIIKRAFWLTRNGATLQVYQTGDETGDDEKGETDNSDTDSNRSDEAAAFNNAFEAELNFGLGCNGRVHVLFERLATAMPFLELIRHVRDTQKSVRVATLLRSDHSKLQVGIRFKVDAFEKTGNTLTSLSPNTPDKIDDSTYAQHLSILSECDLADNNTAFVPITTLGKSTNLIDGRTDETSINSKFKTADPKDTIQSHWLIQNIQPQQRLLICGAGNDVLPLVAMAKQQDWHVTVIDSRPQYAKPSRFITADKVICLPLDANDDLIALSRNAAVAVMSHSLTQDRARLTVLLQHPPLYLGQLGPSYRTERLLSDIKTMYDRANSPIQLEQLDAGIEQLHYPIGLKLGGEGPEALALGIMAQIYAVMYGKQVAIVGQCGRDSNRENTGNSNKGIGDDCIGDDCIGNNGNSNNGNDSNRHLNSKVAV